MLFCKSDSVTSNYTDEVPSDAAYIVLDNGKVVYYEISNNKDPNKMNLKVYNSFQYNHDEIYEFLLSLKNKDGYDHLNIEKVGSEWLWHNIAYGVGIRRDLSASVDVFFNSDDVEHGIFSFIINNINIF